MITARENSGRVRRQPTRGDKTPTAWEFLVPAKQAFCMHTYSQHRVQYDVHHASFWLRKTPEPTGPTFKLNINYSSGRTQNDLKKYFFSHWKTNRGIINQHFHLSGDMSWHLIYLFHFFISTWIASLFLSSVAMVPIQNITFKVMICFWKKNANFAILCCQETNRSLFLLLKKYIYTFPIVMTSQNSIKDILLWNPQKRWIYRDRKWTSGCRRLGRGCSGHAVFGLWN